MSATDYMAEKKLKDEEKTSAIVVTVEGTYTPVPYDFSFNCGVLYVPSEGH